jgi:EAL domain-containing protein (putative c-di-GMP-specific phosphodiesterase class I)
MHFFGLILYIGIPALFWNMEAGRSFIVQSYQLAQEITILIGASFVYPLLVFILAYIFRGRAFSNAAYFKSQVHLGSTLAVSLGLVGTFIGLAEMVAGIASSMGAEGDFATKMASLLAAIGHAMDSMSLAFITSTLGVGSSMLILLASNFLESFFAGQVKSESESETNSAASTANFDALMPVFENMNEMLENIKGVQQSQDRLIEESKQLISQQNSQMVQGFDLMSTRIMQAMQQIKEDQNRAFEQNHQTLVQHSSQMLHGFETMVNSVKGMGQAMDSMSEVNTRTSLLTLNVIEKSSQELTAISTILHDLRLALALPVDESLKKAIKNDELYLIYQPQKDNYGKLVGAECFLRWEDPVRGMISNADLFEVAKEANLLIAVDKWVMQAAVKQLSDWLKQGIWQHDMRLSINVSSDHFLHAGFISFLEDLLTNNAVPASCFALEITENIIMANPDECRDKIRQVKALGVNMFIDDFGTGYSSLMSLKTLKIDLLKIDRDIVKNLVSDEESTSVLKTIINLAKELNIKVAAEGIESQEEMKLLMSEGCSLFQGYLIGRPIKATDFATKIAPVNANHEVTMP